MTNVTMAGISRALKIAPAVVVGAVATAIIAANRSFEQDGRRKVVEMFARRKQAEPQLLTEADIQGLPEPVQRWLRYSQVIGKERVTTVRLKQKGLFRMAANMPWAPIEADEYYTVDPPALVWLATMKLSPFLWIKGRDMYEGGHGNMQIRLLGLVPVVAASGPELDQGTVLRYLSEIPWFPSAAVSDYITWEPVDGTSAKATMSYGGVTGSATFYFDEKGAMKNLVAQRYRMVGKGYEMDRWETPAVEEREFGGVRIAAKGDAIWKLDSGDLPYGKLEITEVEYNNPSLY